MKIRILLPVLAVSCGFFTNLCLASVPFWTKAALPWGYWHALASSGDGNVLIAATGSGSMQGAVYVSTNSGANWILTSAPTAIWTSVAASEDGHLLFAAAGGDVGRDHIYFSTNFGASWTVSGAPATNWYAIACSDDGTKLVAAGAGPCSYGPIFVSADAGATWTATDTPVTNWWSVASSPDGSKLAAGSVEGGIYLSTNSGATWRHSALTNRWIMTVTISADGQRLAASSGDGLLYLSADSGNTWTLITNVPGVPSTVAASADGTELSVWSLLPLPYNQYASGIYFSTDAGMTWTTNQWPYVDLGGNTMAYFAFSADGGTLMLSLGYDGVFTWQAPPPSGPIAVTQPAAGTNGDFMLYGVVNPNRRETWSWFDWDTSPAFGNSSTSMFTGGAWGDVPLSAALSGFSPGVAVYFRIVAGNDFGLSIGQPVIYQAPRITLLGDNPMYLTCGDTYTEPGSMVSALPVAIAAGENYGLALKADRIVVGWGNAPVVPCALTGVVTIAAGRSHSLALKNDGTVVAWGDDTHGGTDVPENLDNAVAVAAGFSFSLALKSDGTVVGWGFGATNHPIYDGLNFGQAMAPEGLSNVVAIAAGYDSSLALKSDGTVVGWGDPIYGGTIPPPGLSNVTAMAAGAAFGLALKSDGHVVGWGWNESGQTNVPAGLNNVVAIAAGYYHGLALKDDGMVVGWGDNQYGQASPPTGLSNVVAIAAATYQSLALKADGTVVGWGLDAFGGTEAPTNLIESLGTAEAAGPVPDGYGRYGGYGYTPGIYLRTYTATNPRGGVANTTRTVIVLGALEAEQRVLAQMIGLKGIQKIRRLPQLDLAIAGLNRALATNLWVGDVYLADSGGQNVFAEDAIVANRLDRLMKQRGNPIPMAVMQGWVESLVKSARFLAIRAIQARGITPGGGYSILSPYVADQMIKGDQAAAAHQYTVAILYYGNVWNNVIHPSYHRPHNFH